MKARDEILDLVRGLSALMVLLAHIRAFVFLDLGQLDHPNLLTKGFYFVTGLHHQAVMVFFVLSGYFVGGSVIDAYKSERFSCFRYGVARLARLWVVLLPALLLTLLSDGLGRGIRPEAYAGAFRPEFMSGPEAGAAGIFSVVAFIGNATFLQTICTPVFGSNGPLWSLANEFWYYVLFPLAIFSVLPIRATPKKKVFVRKGFCFLLLIALLWWLPTHLLAGGLVWVLGALVWCASHHSDFKTISRSLAWKLFSVFLFLATLVASKTDSPLGSDLAVGFAFASFLPSLLGVWPQRGWWIQIGSGLSAISYTLYVVHFPLLFLVVSVQFLGKQFPPSAIGFVWFGCLTLICLSFAYAMWWIFERKTDSVRNFVNRIISKGIGLTASAGSKTE